MPANEYNRQQTGLRSTEIGYSGSARDGGTVIDFQLRHAVAGLLGVLVAAVVLQPFLRGIFRAKTAWVQVGTAAVALSLLIPVVLVLWDQTQHFRARGLTEVGSPAFQEPPMSEAAARAIRNALRPGESWATTTSLGRCRDIDIDAFYWLAFRLIRNIPNCTNPDVELYLRGLEPPPGATIIERGKDYAVVRR